MKKKSNGVINRAIVTPAKHAQLHDKAAIKLVCKAIELVKPNIYVDLGDLGEFSSVSHWQWKRKKKPPLEYIMPRVDEDVKAVNELLDIIDESLDKVKERRDSGRRNDRNRNGRDRRDRRRDNNDERFRGNRNRRSVGGYDGESRRNPPSTGGAG